MHRNETQRLLAPTSVSALRNISADRRHYLLQSKLNIYEYFCTVIYTDFFLSLLGQLTLICTITIIWYLMK